MIFKANSSCFAPTKPICLLFRVFTKAGQIGFVWFNCLRILKMKSKITMAKIEIFKMFKIRDPSLFSIFLSLRLHWNLSNLKFYEKFDFNFYEKFDCSFNSTPKYFFSHLVLYILANFYVSYLVFDIPLYPSLYVVLLFVLIWFMYFYIFDLALL